MGKYGNQYSRDAVKHAVIKVISLMGGSMAALADYIRAEAAGFQPAGKTIQRLRDGNIISDEQASLLNEIFSEEGSR